MSYPFDFENELKLFLEKHLNTLNGKTPPPLAESIRYSLLSPGKRIRPRLFLAAAEMMGLKTTDVVSGAIALEMIHCFTLIHDDLPCMDDDDFRRGRPSNHKQFGESTALLAGDALIALAIDTFLDSNVDATRLISGLKRLNWAMGPRGVIGGQALEPLLTPSSQLSEVQEMHRKKTGALFTAALLIPKDFAGISDESEKGQSLATFADELGLAFQVADDLEDHLDGSEAKTPTSILFYLSWKEAQQMTCERLSAASLRLKHSWSDQSWPLIQIADEVQKKLSHAIESSS